MGGSRGGCLGWGLIGALAVGLAPGPAAAGKEVTRIELAFFEDGRAEPVNRATLWIASRRVRIEQHATDARSPGPTLIYRGDQNRVLSVADASRSYAELGGSTLAMLTRAKGGAGSATARRALDAQLEGLPSDQRRALERLLGIARRGDAANRRPVVVEPLGEVDEVAGFRCERVALVRGEASLGEACIAPWDRLGLGSGDLETLRALANFQREAIGARGITPLEFVPDQPYDLIAQFDGLPLSFRRTVDARERSAIRVEAIEAVDLTPDLFEAPAGYARRTDPRAFLAPKRASALASGGGASGPAARAPLRSTPASAAGSPRPATTRPGWPLPAAPASFAETPSSTAGSAEPRPAATQGGGSPVSTRPRLPIRLHP